jgi:hypothetical protein
MPYTLPAWAQWAGLIVPSVAVVTGVIAIRLGRTTITQGGQALDLGRRDLEIAASQRACDWRR